MKDVDGRLVGVLAAERRVSRARPQHRLATLKSDDRAVLARAAGLLSILVAETA